jgi:hypothetical protein
LSHRPRSIRAQRAEQKGQFCGVVGLPQIAQGRGGFAGLVSIAGPYNQTGTI